MATDALTSLKESRRITRQHILPAQNEYLPKILAFLLHCHKRYLYWPTPIPTPRQNHLSSKCFKKKKDSHSVIISERSLPSHGYDLLWSQSIFTYIIPYPLDSRPVRSLIIKTSEVRCKNPKLSQDFWTLHALHLQPESIVFIFPEREGRVVMVVGEITV